MKRKKTKVRILSGALVMTALLMTGCGQEEFEVANYQGQLQEGQETSDYDKDLFYRNDFKAEGPDPFVLDNTERDGYYYLYGTWGSNFCYRSTNMMDWEPVGNALDNLEYNEDGSLSEARRAAYNDIWASEVIYDEEDGHYYMFFSATPQEDWEVQTGEGVAEGTPRFLLYLAVSDSPCQGFKMVDFTDAASCGEENLHDYNKTSGIQKTDESGNVIEGEYEQAYPQYYAKYAFLDPEKYNEFANATGGADENNAGFTCSIDPHPYVDDNGDKYLFWVDNEGQNRINGVKMVNWYQPDWSTATRLLVSEYYTTADADAAATGAQVEKVTYEINGNEVNEGPTLTKHNGLYYMTFSVNRYQDNSYQVAQAISDSPLGTYRKLREEEGGLLLSGSIEGSQEISGTGHHTLVDVGEQTYIVYHRHDDFIAAGGPRNSAIDEIKWITVKDIDGNDLEVMYANGPTCTVQPAIEAYSEYKNIAPEATVSGTEDASYLTDDLLSLYKYGNADFMEYIKETTIDKTTTFTFDFDKARTVCAVMVYNSKMEDSMFRNISNVKLVCEENGKEVIRYIDNIEFSSEYYQTNDFDGTVYYVTPGAAAYAEFDELNVKSIEITVEVPEGQEQVGISEVRILGK